MEGHDAAPGGGFVTPFSQLRTRVIHWPPAPEYSRPWLDLSLVTSVGRTCPPGPISCRAKRHLWQRCRRRGGGGGVRLVCRYASAEGGDDLDRPAAQRSRGSDSCPPAGWLNFHVARPATVAASGPRAHPNIDRFPCSWPLDSRIGRDLRR